MPLPRSQFYGRRTARPLNPARAAALETGLPKYRIELDAEGRLEDFPGLFPDKQEIWLEIGFGGGEHLLEQARRNPHVGLIGCEPFVNGVSMLVKGLETEGIANIRVFTEDARFLLKALPDHGIARAFILFADPWPKKRHHKRRIVNPDTLDDLARVLHPSGELLLATDDPDLAAWYEEVVPAHPGFTLSAVGGDAFQQRPADWPQTRYEQKALTRGRQPFYYRAISV